MPDLPPAIADLVDELAGMPGALAVVLGGSRAVGANNAGSDWDLGLYYRGRIDLTALAARGVVYAPGSWGRIMNGGAWLRCADDRVDVLLRDLDVVEHYARMHAKRGTRVGTIGQAAKAVMEEAHAIVCERGRWVCNEKGLIEAAGLDDVQGLFGDVPSQPAGLVEWVDRVARQLGVPPGEAAPWNAAPPQLNSGR